ncbi:serine-enriched protein-like isoform X2 [Acanthaster planci]|uniref:Serine-enriched protein-like isoform X2 n=1 Tax=Acanthaster planci TaxID=133434 RepID=A0A8B7XXF5_ACAPL|nr:serine-enriched protein-like isoform X2 [Acanthaster planci]
MAQRHTRGTCQGYLPHNRTRWSGVSGTVYSVQEESPDLTKVKSAPISPVGRMVTRNFFENKLGLADDLKFISRMPELCDVTFLVGDRREPVCAVRAILAARSRVFHKLLYSGTVTPSSSPRRRANSMESRFARKTVSFLTRSKSNGDPDGSNSASKCPRTVLIEEFEPAVFLKLVDYCHTGCVVLNAETALGLMNAADYYGLDELRRTCVEYMHGCLDLSTVCLLLASAEKYIQYKATKTLVQRALEFVDEHGEDVLGFPAFLKLPQHVVRLVLSRDELQADELTKFRAALAWSTLHFRNTPGTSIKGAMSPFIDTIAFHLIPASDLMQEVRDSGVVPDHKIMTALAFQADPGSVDARSLSATPNRVRLSMLSLSLDDRSSTAGDTQSAAETERTELSDDEAPEYNRSNSGSLAMSPEFRRLSTVDSDDGQSGNRTDQMLETGLEDAGIIHSHHCDNDPHAICENVPDNHSYHFKSNLERPHSADELSTANSLSNFDSLSMSTSSDVTDSSSAGGSFGRADQKSSVHSMGTKSPIPGTPF